MHGMHKRREKQPRQFVALIHDAQLLFSRRSPCRNSLLLMTLKVFTLIHIRHNFDSFDSSLRH
jgi:hypothetical protein